MPRARVLRVIGSIIAVALMALFIYYLILELPGLYLHPEEQDPTELGARGEYLGYLIGVPVAIGGALAAVLIALSTDQVARHQMLLAASDYRDKKMEAVKERVRDFAECLQRVRRTADLLSDDLYHLRVKAESTTEFLNAAQDSERCQDLHDRMMENLDELSRTILALSADEVVHAAVEQQRSSTDNKIRDRVSQFWGDYDTAALSRDILDIRDRIDQLVADNTVEDSAAAVMLMPPDYHSLDFLGAFIRVVDKDGRPAKALLRNQQLHPGDELMNYGLALLGALYQLLPSDMMISDAISSLYGIESMRRKATLQFKAREVYFSRTTLDVVNQVIDGERLFLKVISNNVVGEKAVRFLPSDEEPPRSRASRAIARLMPSRPRRPLTSV